MAGRRVAARHRKCRRVVGCPVRPRRSGNGRVAATLRCAPLSSRVIALARLKVCTRLVDTGRCGKPLRRLRSLSHSTGLGSGLDTPGGSDRVAHGSCPFPIAAGFTSIAFLDPGSRHGIAPSACSDQRDRRLADAARGRGLDHRGRDGRRRRSYAWHWLGGWERVAS